MTLPIVLQVLLLTTGICSVAWFIWAVWTLVVEMYQ